MIHWQGTTTMDATNSTTAEEFVTFTTTLIEGIDYPPEDEAERTYQTFREGCEFRLARWHIHPWIIEPVTHLAPTPMRPRRIEESGYRSRWTSGFL